MSSKTVKTRSPWAITGRILQYFQDNFDEDLYLNKIFNKILRLTAQYGKRYAYIRGSDFNLSEKQRKRIMKKLKEANIIGYERTSVRGSFGLTKFWIILPKEIEDEIEWKDDKRTETGTEKKSTIEFKSNVSEDANGRTW